MIMHASTQERFKHCVPPQPAIDIFRPAFPRRPLHGRSPTATELTSAGISTDSQNLGSNCRINITFRFYRPDYRPESIPRCKCGVPCILRPDMKNRIDRQAALSSSSPSFFSTDERIQEPNKDNARGNASDNSTVEIVNSIADGSDDGSAEKSYTTKYWWTCYSGAQNGGKGCGMWKVMDVKAEGRGPFFRD